MPIPEFNGEGDLPEGVHRTALIELLDRFGNRSDLRQRATDALLLVLNLAMGTACLDRFIIFGSYITAKAEPNDVDIFLVMSSQFDIDNQTGNTREMFTHRHAQRSFNASVFLVNRQSSFASIDGTVLMCVARIGAFRISANDMNPVLTIATAASILNNHT